MEALIQFADSLFTPRNAMMLATVLFCIGIYGVLARRNVLVMLMSLELMLVAVNVILVLFSQMEAQNLPLLGDGLEQAHRGQVFTLMVMTVAAGEVGVGLAIAVALYRVRRSLDVRDAVDLKH